MKPRHIAAAVPVLLALTGGTAHAGVTIGLTGGAPLDAAGQARVYDDGVRWMSWAGNQPWTNPADPRLKLRVGLRDGLTLPALQASIWATSDESWLNHVPPMFVQEQVDVIHAAGGQAITNQGWSMLRSQWPTVAEIAAYPGDIVSVDTYPTPTHPLAEMAGKVQLMHQAAHGRPVWAALQVCSRSNFQTGLAPTAATEWKMAKRALDNGAHGIMFFGSSYKACFQTPEDVASGFNWSAYRSTVLPTIQRIRAYTAARTARLKRASGQV
jgi:hypothetical protein